MPACLLSQINFVVNNKAELNKSRTSIRKPKTIQNEAINFITFTYFKGLPLEISLTDQEPQQKKGKQDKKKQSRPKRMDKNTCSKCNRKTSLTGHIRCTKCLQWLHLKCVGLQLSEAQLKKADYKCDVCKQLK